MAAKRQFPYVTSRRRADGTLAYRGYVDVVERDGDKARRRRIFTDTFDDPEDAYAARCKMAAERENTAPADSLDEAIEALRVELRTKRTKGTLRWYEDHLRAVCRLIPGETSLHAITNETVEQFVRDRLRVVEGQRRVKPQTVNADLRALHRVFAVAIRRGVVKVNPVRMVDRPRADAPAFDWFTDDELRAAVAKIRNRRAADVVLVLGLTGIRRSELARLEPGHVRLNLRQLVVPGKTATRVVPLSPAAEVPIKRLLATATNVLMPRGVHEIDELMALAKADVGDRRMHAHSLRHTFGSALVRAGVRLDVVMRLMGHRDIKTSMRYAHEVGAEGVQAVQLLRFVPPDESGQPAPG